MTAVVLGAMLTIVNGYPFVDVSIGGRGPFRMLIDTGASSCSLTPEAARAAQVTFDHRVVLTTIAGERLVPAASSVHIRVGSTEAGEVEVLAMDLGGVRQVDGHVDGVLGQSFLGRFAYLIDYRQKVLWLGDEARRRAPSLATEIVAERVDGRMVLPVGIGAGERWKLTLDSGAIWLVMRCGAHCPQLRKAHDGEGIVTNSGESAVRSGVLRRVRIGSTIIPSAPAALIGGPALNGEDGVLPASWFSAIYVDSARNLVRLGQ